MEKIRSLYPSVMLIAGLVITSLITTYLLVNVGIVAGPVIIVSLGSMLLLLWMFKEYKIGIYVMFIFSVFMAFINRMMGTQIQFGIPLDILAGLTFIMMFLGQRDKLEWSGMRSWVTYSYIIIVAYQLLQVLNPNAVSLLGWLVGLRGLASFLLFFVFYQMFLSIDNVKKFTWLWIGLSTIVALYGIYQEVFGLSAKEIQWIEQDEVRRRLLLIWGHIRKFSLLSDPSAFGLFMALGALGSYVLMLGPFQGFYKMLFGLVGTLMLISMSFSGTRTAYAMFAFGVAFYILVTLRNRKTLLVMIAAGFGFLLLLFGPFYGGPMGRIRSTFQLGDDASMNVRDQKRIRLQNYVLTHPFGGGMNTTGKNGLKYSAGHPLAEGWDADSGYLLIALESGWIGLTFALLFFIFVVTKGIDNYFSINDPLGKTLNLAYIVPFMALSVAHFTQDAMFQKPMHLVVVATYGLVLALPAYYNNQKLEVREKAEAASQM